MNESVRKTPLPGSPTGTEGRCSPGRFGNEPRTKTPVAEAAPHPLPQALHVHWQVLQALGIHCLRHLKQRDMTNQLGSPKESCQLSNQSELPQGVEQSENELPDYVRVPVPESVSESDGDLTGGRQS